MSEEWSWLKEGRRLKVEGEQVTVDNSKFIVDRFARLEKPTTNN
jgi:hypothetical protein